MRMVGEGIRGGEARALGPPGGGSQGGDSEVPSLGRDGSDRCAWQDVQQWWTRPTLAHLLRLQSMQPRKQILC